MKTGPVIAYRQRLRGGYELVAPIRYWSPRYRKWITLPAGMVSDGASGPAEDLASLGWWVHDRLCETLAWDDGTACTAWQRSAVLHDILWSEGRRVRACTWWLATGVWESWRDLWRHEA